MKIEANIPRYTFVPCGHVHERHQLKSYEHTVEAVEACVLRTLGTNLLCAHQHVGPQAFIGGEHSEGAYIYMLDRIRSVQGTESLFKEFQTLQDLTLGLDHIVRASYSGGHEARWLLHISRSYDFGEDIISSLDEMLGILGRCGLLSLEESPRHLNTGERTRFLYLTKLIQGEIQKLMEGVITQIEQLEENMINV